MCVLVGVGYLFGYWYLVVVGLVVWCMVGVVVVGFGYVVGVGCYVVLLVELDVYLVVVVGVDYVVGYVDYVSGLWVV